MLDVLNAQSQTLIRFLHQVAFLVFGSEWDPSFPQPTLQGHNVHFGQLKKKGWDTCSGSLL